MGRVVNTSEDDAKNAESGFPVYAEGQYIGTIRDFKDTVAAKTGANANKPAHDVVIKFTESSTGEGIGKSFTAFRVPDFPKWASGSVAFLFYQFYKAIGVKFEDGDTELPDKEDVIGQDIGVTLGIEDAQDKNGNVTGKRNRVQGFFDSSKGITAVVSVESDTNTDFVL